MEKRKNGKRRKWKSRKNGKGEKRKNRKNGKTGKTEKRKKRKTGKTQKLEKLENWKNRATEKVRIFVAVVGEKSEKDVFGKQKQAEQTPFSKSPGRETPACKISNQTELKSGMFDQPENCDIVSSFFR